MEPTVTKRLHIAGLTPSISQQDLSQRLSSFGNVKSLDGLGLLDGNGQPRKFAYATLEATPAKLSKCMNTLSGSTWKGTKLRLGEAKPDFRERVLAENAKHALEASEGGPPRKKRRRGKYQAIHAKDMEPTTTERAKEKGAWVVTPLGRVHRPLKMRPLRPLPPLPPSISVARSGGDAKGKGKDVRKERKRAKKPDARARRKKIDMTKFGSVYLKGRFLDVDVPEGVGVGGIVEEGDYMRVEGGTSEEEDEDVVEKENEDVEGDDEEREDEDEREESESEEEAVVVQQTSARTRPHSHSPPPVILTAKPQPPQSIPASTSSGVDFTLEKQHSMNILASLFGASSNDDEDAWIGKESPGSDVDEADLKSTQSRVQTRGAGDDDIGFELVPRESGRVRHPAPAEDVEGVEAEEEEEEEEEEEVGMDVDEDEQGKQDQVPLEEETLKDAKKQAPAKTSTKLKDLFAPREMEGGFSLLGHLNLDVDLELDEDVPFSIAHDEVDLVASEPAVGEETTSISASVPPSTVTSKQTKEIRTASQITLDPSKPLFFPLAMLSAHPSVTPSFTSSISTNARNKPKDLYDTLAAKGWDWRSAGFYRTQSEDEIREKWEREKGELTRGWKKRWREAGRIGRRRGRGAGAGGEDV